MLVMIEGVIRATESFFDVYFTQLSFLFKDFSAKINFRVPATSEGPIYRPKTVLGPIGGPKLLKNSNFADKSHVWYQSSVNKSRLIVSLYLFDSRIHLFQHIVHI